MKTKKILLTFRNVKDGDLVETANFIVSSMSGNQYFPNPIPSLDTVSDAIKAYADAYSKCYGGTKESTALKNEKRSLLEKLLASLGNYVNAIAEGKAGKLRFPALQDA